MLFNLWMLFLVIMICWRFTKHWQVYTLVILIHMVLAVIFMWACTFLGYEFNQVNFWNWFIVLFFIECVQGLCGMDRSMIVTFKRLEEEGAF